MEERPLSPEQCIQRECRATAGLKQGSDVTQLGFQDDLYRVFNGPQMRVVVRMGTSGRMEGLVRS